MTSPFARAGVAAATCAVLALAPAAPAAAQDGPRPPHAFTGFALGLFRQVAGQAPDGNAFLSPFSAALAVGMTLNGAGGETEAAIRRALALPDSSLEAVNRVVRATRASLDTLHGPVLEEAGALWVRAGTPLNPLFTRRARQVFGAQAATLDFAAPGAARAVNDWARRRTGGRIREVVQPPLSPATHLVLVNTIYFKARWWREFDQAETRERPFWAPSGRRMVPMMRQVESFGYLEGPGFRAAGMSYEGLEVTMFLFLPDSGSSLGALYGRMTPRALEGWLAEMDWRPLDLSVPRFRAETELDLRAPLSALGMEVAFDTLRADFRPLFAPGFVRPGRNAALSRALQKTFIAVDEEGTEAAGATTVLMGVAMGPGDQRPPPVLVFDRPFFFLIRDDATGGILFMGQITEPGDGSA